MKILRPSSNYVAGIFFPIGRLEKGGTCQYASEKCLKECYGLNKHHDVTVDIPEEDKQKIYKFITGESTLKVCNTIIQEMGELQSRILSWFCTGDCPDRDIEKIYQIMLLLNQEGVIQNGFTRNEDFYETIRRDGILNYIVLTVESKDIKDAPRNDFPEGLWAIPDYNKGIVKLYHGKLANTQEYGSCGYHSTKTFGFKGKEIEIATNCYGCFKQKIGCFIELPLIETVRGD